MGCVCAIPLLEPSPVCCLADLRPSESKCWFASFLEPSPVCFLSHVCPSERWRMQVCVLDQHVKQHRAKVSSSIHVCHSSFIEQKCQAAFMCVLPCSARKEP